MRHHQHGILAAWRRLQDSLDDAIPCLAMSFVLCTALVPFVATLCHPATAILLFDNFTNCPSFLFLLGQLYRRTNEVHHGPQAQYPFDVCDCSRRVSPRSQHLLSRLPPVVPIIIVACHLPIVIIFLQSRKDHFDGFFGPKGRDYFLQGRWWCPIH